MCTFGADRGSMPTSVMEPIGLPVGIPTGRRREGVATATPGTVPTFSAMAVSKLPPLGLVTLRST